MAHPDSTIEQSAISGVTAQKQQTVTEHFCQTCDRYFASNEALQDHSLHNRKHAKKSNIPWVQKHKKLHLCRTCNKVLESKREREAHRHDEGRRQRQTTNPLPDLGLWTTIPPSNYEQTIESIRNLCHHESTLHKAQFSFNDHPALFQYAAHCQHCGASEKGIRETNRTCDEPHTAHSIVPARPRPSSDAREYVKAPISTTSPEIRQCVALDCEMVELAFGKEALAQLCAIDVLTGEVLIDRLVAPPPPEIGRVVDWRTKFTNITPDLMEGAISSNTALPGVNAAREELFKYVNADTVLVGHALKNDLEILGMEHSKIVDSQILLCKPKKRWKISLRDACRGLLQREIQNHGAEGDGHDCKEDVMAARELVFFYLENAKMMRDWAQVKLWGVRDEKKKMKK